jgi:SPX domain protein involved in polyphosphate accumulation
MAIEKFFREEQKYYLTKKEYQTLLNNIHNEIEPDLYYKETICNIYFDNDNNDLIINSLNKPIYKEKIRLRSYNKPKPLDNVYLEIKKKFKGMVYKRRVTITYKEAMDYIYKGIMPNKSQIMKEIDYAFKKNNLKPKISISYDRESYISKKDNNFRITFDHNIRSSTDYLKLDNLNKGKLLFDDCYIMEIKTLTGIPFWFLKTITELKLYPRSISKYGEIYKHLKEEELYV